MPPTHASAPQREPFFKDIPVLQTVPPEPPAPIAAKPSFNADQKALMKCFNRLGGLMLALGGQVSVDPMAVLAVWLVESSGRSHTPNKATIRFECNLFYKAWGKNNPDMYGKHFCHGGFNNTPGKPWENHACCEVPGTPFIPFHSSQDSEYKALALAARLAGEETALRCISIGGPQIVVDNCEMLGYPSAKAMYDDFQASERAHVLGFFEFCRSKPAPKRGDLVSYLREKRWRDFAYYYNGAGKADHYGAVLKKAFDNAELIRPA